MTIYTRNTSATGVTNKAATLTQNELDGNFVELVAVDATKAGLTTSNTFTAVNTFSDVTNFDTLSQKVNIAGGVVNAYTITDVGLAAPFTGQVLTVDMSAVATNTTTTPTLQVNGGALITISTGTVAGLQVLVGGLVGVQRLVYTGTYWFAIDQLSHYVTTALASDQTLQPGHTFVYDAAAVNQIDTRIIVAASHRYLLNFEDVSQGAASPLMIYPNNVGGVNGTYAFTGISSNGVVGTPIGLTSLVQPGVVISNSDTDAMSSSCQVSITATTVTAVSTTIGNTGANYLGGQIYAKLATASTPAKFGYIIVQTLTMTGRFTITRLS